MKKGNTIALLPIGVFLVIYLGLGIVFEYVLKISMGFYKIPIVVAFLVALLVACLQNRTLSFDKKLELMGKGIGDKNIVTMILIFMAAGIFVGVVGRSSAESVAYFLLSIIPPKYSVAVLFVISCFVSTAMGTSVGTITLIVPIALPIAAASGYSLPLCIATVMGGAMFGDNLSFISDTTIAACNGQGCAMRDKFRENFWIALPAALVTLALILVLTLGADVHPAELPGYNLVQIIPYVLVLIGGIAGINVFVVLLVGIVSGSIIMLATGATAATDLLVNMGAGASGMFETTMVAILVAAIAPSSASTAASTRCSTASRRCSAASGAASSAWVCSSARWTSRLRITPLLSSWRTPSPRRWPRITAFRRERPLPCSTPSPAFFRASSPTAHRCSSPYLRPPYWATRSPPLR